MKTMRHLLMIGLMTFGSVAGFAEEAPRPIKQVNTLKTVMFDRLTQLNLGRYDLTDVELSVTYTVSEAGEVTVTDVTGANTFVNEYVRMMIEKDDVFVDSSLANREVTMNVKYARV